jgi:hypothetical protein
MQQSEANSMHNVHTTTQVRHQSVLTERDAHGVSSEHTHKDCIFSLQGLLKFGTPPERDSSLMVGNRRRASPTVSLFSINC